MVGGLFYRELLPFAAMIVLEFGNVVLNTLFKAATLKGMSYYVFIVYSYAIPAFILLPFPFFFRRSLLPPLNSRIIGKCFILGAIGMELLAWRQSSSQAKIFGTIVSITGALLIILYKGPSIMFTPRDSSMPYYKLQQSSQSEWIIGGVLLGTDYILTPVWYVVQAHILKEYPAELVVVFFYCLFGALVSGAISSVTEPDRAAWMPRPDISLVAILYSGGYELLSTSIQAWILHKKGPFYVAMFKPLSIAIAAAMGVMFLGETLYMGSIIGAAVITLGFYSLMWGKTKENAYEELSFTDPESSSCKTPLLQSLKSENS
ncbi:WAT1-related protein At3g28050-like isoform X2 [Chenopodium quinoa]|uniref:WAT1-related protein At3g28050-like isoform X2 n=1 Tax=Chenopodium quinoa TaxID=63459 RepID=UPI000B795AB7|nr:WAT1-related protein At3g28050-like isoform X2 [Chenopodium quinoa]